MDAGIGQFIPLNINFCNFLFLFDKTTTKKSKRT